jgi:predicted peroxiredoxin
VKSRLAIRLWATDPKLPHLCATPFFYAAAAAATSDEIEVHFAGKSVQLLVRGLTGRLYAGIDRTHGIYAHMPQARRFGAPFYACREAPGAHGVDPAMFVPEVAGIAGAAAFLGRVLNPHRSTLVF